MSSNGADDGRTIQSLYARPPLILMSYIPVHCTKFEVSRFTRYKAMNGAAKCRKWSGLGRLGGTQGHGQCHH